MGAQTGENIVCPLQFYGKLCICFFYFVIADMLW